MVRTRNASRCMEHFSVRHVMDNYKNLSNLQEVGFRISLWLPNLWNQQESSYGIHVFETTLVNLKETFKGGLEKKRDVNLPIIKEHHQFFYLNHETLKWKFAETNLVIERSVLLVAAAGEGSWATERQHADIAQSFCHWWECWEKKLITTLMR